MTQPENIPLSTADRSIILIALGTYYKALERKGTFAPTDDIKQAYAASLAELQTLIDRLRNRNLEF